MDKLMGKSAKPDRTIQSVVRAIQILEYVAANKNLVKLTELSKGLELSKSTVYGLVSTLERLGYLQQTPENGKYSLGLKLFELGEIVHSSMDLRRIAIPYLHQLAAKYSETVHLAVLSRGVVVYIDKVDSDHSIRITSNVGGWNPAHCTGVGKVLLAGLTDVELESTVQEINMKKFTPNTITSMVQLKEIIQNIRLQGYALDNEEIEIGLTCVAAPVKNHKGKVVASISISGPTNRMKDRLEQMRDEVIVAARNISAELGCGP